MYIANINIKSEKATYKKGDMLGNEFSEKDIKRFLKMNAIFSRGEDFSTDILNGCELDEIVFLDESDLRKKNKSELIQYGKSIGFDVSEDLMKEEMINSLLNYIEEEKDNE